MSFPDVPSPIDFLNADDARAWSDKAMQRPFREDFFAAFASQLQQIDKPPCACSNWARARDSWPTIY